jgi:RNA polymerase sigma factor (sigma-70 family)
MAGDAVAVRAHPDASSDRPAERRAALDPRPAEADDRTLLQRSRAGDTDAFAELFRRYRLYAVRVAARTTGDLDPDDASAEAFARVWRSLRNGGGPDHSFKSYLATAVRNVIVNGTRGPREVPTEPLVLAEVVGAGENAADDVAVGIAEAARVVAAFGTLPERWRVALWATEVEGRPVAELAESLRLSSNAASALCLRAREGLRVAWLQSHVERLADDSECRWVLDRLAAHARGRLPKGQRARLERHLDECDSCAATSKRLAVIGGALRVATLFVGTGVTLASLRILGLLGGAATATAATSSAATGGHAAQAASSAASTGGRAASSASATLPAGIAAAVITVAAAGAALGLVGTSMAGPASGEPLGVTIVTAASRVTSGPVSPAPTAPSATPSPRRSVAPTPRPIPRAHTTRATHAANTPKASPTATDPVSPSPTPTVPESPSPTPEPPKPSWTPGPPEPSWTPGPPEPSWTPRPTPPHWTPRPTDPPWTPRPTIAPTDPYPPAPLTSPQPGSASPTAR